MGKVIGIDLGIINFCVVIMDGFQLCVIENVEGDCIMLFIVVFIDDECLVGQLVKCQVVMNLDNIVFGVKCLIGCCFDDLVVEKDKKMVLFVIVNGGNGDVWVEVQGEKYFLFQIFVFILGKMKEIVEVYFGEDVI